MWLDTLLQIIHLRMELMGMIKQVIYMATIRIHHFSYQIITGYWLCQKFHLIKSVLKKKDPTSLAKHDKRDFTQDHRDR